MLYVCFIPQPSRRLRACVSLAPSLQAGKEGVAVRQGDFVWILATTGGGRKIMYTLFFDGEYVYFAREANWIALKVRE